MVTRLTHNFISCAKVTNALRTAQQKTGLNPSHRSIQARDSTIPICRADRTVVAAGPAIVLLDLVAASIVLADHVLVVEQDAHFLRPLNFGQGLDNVAEAFATQQVVDHCRELQQSHQWLHLSIRRTPKMNCGEQPRNAGLKRR
eukprot:SAG31_NODE_639_length_13309_cov_4.008468_11_plen_144_part_00